MQYSLMTLATLIGAAIAQTAGFDPITAPTRDEVLTAGSSYTVEWSPDATYNADTITIQLLAGASNVTLQLGEVVASGLSNSAGKYVWAIPSTLEKANVYGFKLYLDKDSSVFQYSNPFSIKFDAASSTSVAAHTSTVAHTSVASSTEVVKATTSAVDHTSAAAHTSVVDHTSSTAAPVVSTAVFSNTTKANTDLPEPATVAPSTLSTVAGAASATGTGSVHFGNTTVVTAGASTAGAPLALLAGAIVALVF